MKNILAITLLLLMSCNSNLVLQRNTYSIIKFKERFPSGNKIIIQKYYLSVPASGILKKGNYNYTGDYHTEYRIIYADSSIMYISNDNLRGSKLNMINRVEIGINGITKTHEKDTLFLEGVQKNGKHWKEFFLGDIIVGYTNIKNSDKAKFDKAIISLRRCRFK